MKIILLFIISCLTSLFCCIASLPVDTLVIQTLYNAMCVVFSIGMVTIVTFSLEGVKNQNYIKDIRENINQIRNKFIFLFTLCTLLLILEKYWPNKPVFTIDIQTFARFATIVFFALSIGYFVYNFTRVQKLKNDIFDRLLAESKNK